LVEGQHVGQLQGFCFTADPHAAGEAAKALNAAAQKALAGEIESRATRVYDAVDEAFALANDGTIRWLGEPVGKITAGPTALSPAVRLIADEQLTGAALDKVKQRLELWLSQHVKKLLGSLEQLEKGEGLEGVARGVAFQLAEELGVLERSRVAKDVKSLSQEDRAALRKLGVRFGAYHIYLPLLLKPAPRSLAALLWALHHGGLENVKGLDEVPHYAASGRTSFAANPEIAKGFYRAAGFRVCGERVVRVDILERLADLIRPAISYRPGVTAGDPPSGAADGEGFVVTVAMTSLTGCAGEAFASILKSLGYLATKRPGPAITVPLLAPAPTEPFMPPASTEKGVEAEQVAESGGSGPGETAVEAEAAEPAPVVAAEEETANEPLEVVSETVESAAPAEASAEGEAAPASEGAEEGAAAIEAPVEIEVWTMQRHAYSGPRHHAGAQRSGRRKEGQPEAASASPPRPERARFARAGGQGEPSERRARPDGALKEAGFRSGGKPRPDQRGAREDDRRNRRGPAFSTAEKRERERPVDPDSPFAKLLALKAELEKKR
jgi:ATP-dependent RNA helicase SUPV3L1/SUV3